MGNPETPVRNEINRLIGDGREIGVQVAAYSGEKLKIDVAMGATAESGGEPVTSDTLFSVFSIAKGVTAFAAHILADRGLLDFDAPIADIWPEFGANGKDEVALRDVLTHRAGIPQMPDGVTPERMCDWEWMTSQIAALTPIVIPKVDSAYMAMSFGWVVGEVVRRIDPKNRPIERFVQEEICAPLGIADLHLTLPDDAAPRYAKHSIVPDPLPPEDSLNMKALPKNVRLVPDVFSRPDVLRAAIPAVNGIANARSVARFFAMIANEGELDGVRIVSSDRIRGLLDPRTEGEEFEPVLMRDWRLSTGGFFLASSNKPAVGAGPHILFGMGMGGTLAWADLENRVATAITHNKMYNARTSEDDPLLPVADAIREGLGLLPRPGVSTVA
jgi:CubicO group peptidase (beta-lactamase class C family)